MRDCEIESVPADVVDAKVSVDQRKVDGVKADFPDGHDQHLSRRQLNQSQQTIE
jgi:hypothetical protein